MVFSPVFPCTSIKRRWVSQSAETGLGRHLWPLEAAVGQERRYVVHFSTIYSGDDLLPLTDAILRLDSVLAVGEVGSRLTDRALSSRRIAAD